MKKLIYLCAALVAFSCTQNDRVKHFGGTEELTLKPDEEFINATWKKNDLWIVTKNTKTGQFYLREHSRYGIVEGTYIFNKHK